MEVGCFFSRIPTKVLTLLISGFVGQLEECFGWVMLSNILVLLSDLRSRLIMSQIYVCALDMKTVLTLTFPDLLFLCFVCPFPGRPQECECFQIEVAKGAPLLQF